VREGNKVLLSAARCKDLRNVYILDISYASAGALAVTVVCDWFVCD
jgi:hypothetical protein